MDEVSGVVRYEDGTRIPADRIVVRFEPLEKSDDVQVHPKAATTVADPTDGSFGEFSTFRYGDGVVRGRHKVLIVATAKPEDGAARQLTPAAYGSMSTTPLEVDTADSPFEFLIPKTAN